METIADRIANYLDTNKMIWNEIERMQMVLGFQILIHNIVMIGTILFFAAIAGVLWDSIILLTVYGLLKVTAGGVHFKKSSACLIGTGVFVAVGVMISRQVSIELIYIILVYVVCIIVFTIIGPQGTENNPISEEKCKKLKKKTVLIIFNYFFISYFMYKENLKIISYLILIAVVFETLSLLTSFIKSREG